VVLSSLSDLTRPSTEAVSPTNRRLATGGTAVLDVVNVDQPGAARRGVVPIADAEVDLLHATQVHAVEIGQRDDPFLPRDTAQKVLVRMRRHRQTLQCILGGDIQGAWIVVGVAPPYEGPVELPVMETEPTQGEIGESGQINEYIFKVKKAGQYTVQTMGRTDLIMSLYGPDNKTTLIAKDDDSGEKLNPKIVTDLVPGTYYVVVQHYSATGMGAYSIKVSR